MNNQISFDSLINNINNNWAKEPQFQLFFNNGEQERREDGALRVLSLFSGCGGMDLGLEGGFVCQF